MISSIFRKKFPVAAIVGLLVGGTSYYLFFQIPGVISKTRFGFALLTALTIGTLMIYFWPSLLRMIAKLDKSQQLSGALIGLFFSLLFLFGYLIFPDSPLENLLIPFHKFTIVGPYNSIDRVEITWLHSDLGDLSFSTLQVEGGDAERQGEHIVFTPFSGEKMKISWEGRAWNNLVIGIIGNQEPRPYNISLNEYQETWYLNHDPGNSIKKTLPIPSPTISWILPALCINLTILGLLTFLIYFLMAKFSDSAHRAPVIPFIAILISAAAIIAALALVLYIGWFNRYLYDDYCYASSSHNLGFGKCMEVRLNNTNGRFSQLALLCIMDRLQPLGFRLSVGIAQIALFFSSYLALHNIFPNRSKHSALIFSAGYEILILLGVPYIEHTIIWYSGMVTVVPPLIFFNLILALIWNLSFKQKSSKWMWGGLFLLAVLAAGFNETQTAVLIGLGLLFLALTQFPQIRSLRTGQRPVAIALLGTLVGFGILSSLPGTASRIGRYEQVYTLSQLAVRSIHCSMGTLRSIFQGSIGAVIYAGVCFSGLLAGIHLGQRKETAQHLIMFAAISLFMGIAAYIGSFIPSMVATNNCLPFRSMITPEYFLLLGLFLSSYWLGRAINPYPMHRAVWAVALLNILFLVAFYNRYIPVLNKYMHYAAGYDQRQVVIENALADGLTYVKVDPILSPQELFGDILNTYNPCAAQYFGIDVRLNTQPPEFK